MARREFRCSLRFCAPELFCLAQGVTPVNGVRGKANMSTKCSSGAVPGGVLPNPSLLPAKPSEADSPGRGGARERTQFSPPGGNGVEWTLRRRAAMGKVGRRPRAAKSPCKKRNRSIHCPLIRPSVRTGAPSPQGEGLRAADSRPYEINANIRRGPRPARFACVLFGMTFTECQ